MSLQPHQRHLVDFALERPRSAWFAGMGVGKTFAALELLDTLFTSGAETRPALVAAPLRVAKNVWPAEAQKWGLRHVEVSAVVGTEKERVAALGRDASVYSINYDNLPWLVERLGDSWPFGMVIADESTRLKNFRLKQGGTRARALGRVAHTHTGRWLNLTGTPAPNGLADLWGQTWFIDAGQRLGRTYGGFLNRWFQAVPGGDGYAQVRALPFAAEQIHDRLRDVCLSLRAEDWFDIEAPIVRTIPVELPDKARAVYQDMERELFAQIEQFEVEALNAAARSQKCLQIAAGAVYVDDQGGWRRVHDAKLEALESIMQEAAGMPVLVSYQWKHDAARILDAFPKARLLDDDKQTEDDWNAGKIPILVAHPKSCGHGLNLQDGGNILVYFSDWWDLELHDQIFQRIGPMRQKQSGHARSVFVYNIIATDTIDELMPIRHATKRDVQDLLMEAMRARR